MTTNNDDTKKEVLGITLKDSKNNGLSDKKHPFRITPNHPQTNSDNINVANNAAQRISQDDELMKKIFPHKEVIKGKIVSVFPYIEEVYPLKDVPEEVVSKMEKTTLTEQWKKGKIKRAKYWVKYRNGNIDIWELSEGITIESKPEIIEVLAPVLSFEECKDLKSHDEKATIKLGEKIIENDKLKELLKEWIHYYPIVLYEYEDTLKTKDIIELYDRTREVLK